MAPSNQFIAPCQYNSAPLSGCHGYVLPAAFEMFPPRSVNLRVLDVGCGNGSVAREVAKRGCNVVGIDISETGVAIARRQCPEARFEVMAADEKLLANLGEEPFDLVLSFEVIEHVYAIRSFLAACFAALRPGGTFICSTPYHGYAKNLLLSLSGGWDRHLTSAAEGEHIRFFSRRTLSLLLEQAGFCSFQFAGAGRFPYLWKSMVIAASKT